MEQIERRTVGDHHAFFTAAATNVVSRLFGTSSTSLEDARDVWEQYLIAPGTGLRLDAYLTSADMVLHDLEDIGPRSAALAKARVPSTLGPYR